MGEAIFKGRKYGMGSWFVFFVQTGKEETVCEHFNNMFSNEELISFIPKIELIYKNSKQVRKEFKPMFPSYVFVETERDGRSFASLTAQIVRNSKYIIKLLGKDNPDYMAVHEEEKDFLLGFYDDEYIVGESLGFIEGDMIFINSGPLQGKESIIKRIDRHKRRAGIELELLGDIRLVSVALEIVEKI